MKKSVIILLHAGYWLLYLLLLTVLLLFLSVSMRKDGISPGSPFFIIYGLFTIPAAISGFYLSYTFLFEKFLKPRRILLLFASGIAVAVISGFIASLLLSLYFGLHFMFTGGSSSFFSELTVISLLIGLPNIIIGLVMRGFISWFGDVKAKEELLKKNFETELALMKAQINPHFLFNTLNNIDVLILKEPARASEYLNKLSDLMRFMLYETKTDKILLEQELSYIGKYIELQKIRTSNPAFVSCEISGDTAGRLIEPMLFIPFIENAFKHTENKKAENAIRIRIAIEKEKITFECENKFSAASQLKPDYGGLGNELIRKRLNLLYPGSHDLEITEANGIFSVKLTLTASE